MDYNANYWKYSITFVTKIGTITSFSEFFFMSGWIFDSFHPQIDKMQKNDT